MTEAKRCKGKPRATRIKFSLYVILLEIHTMWFSFKALSSLTCMWFIMVHTWNVFLVSSMQDRKMFHLQHVPNTLSLPL